MTMGDPRLDAVRALEDARIEAMCTQDADTLDRLLSDTMVYVHTIGTVDTKASFLGHVRNGPLQYRSFERRDVAAQLAGDATAVFTGAADARVELAGDPLDLRFRFLAVWACHDGTWRFEAWQAATITD